MDIQSLNHGIILKGVIDIDKSSVTFDGNQMINVEQYVQQTQRKQDRC